MKKVSLCEWMIRNLKMKKLLSKLIPTYKKIHGTVIVGASTVKHLHGSLLQINQTVIT